MTRILVTGATGTVGRHVVRELQARGVSVRALVRDPERLPGVVRGSERLPGVARDPERLRVSARDPERRPGVVRDSERLRVSARDPEALPDVEPVLGDFDDPASLRRALDGVDRVYVSAADSPRKVAHEIAVINAAAEAGVRRIVKLSAMHADPASALPAYRWHGEIEAALHRSGVPVVILRPAFFMTNLLMVAGSVAQTGMLHAPTAGRRVAMIDVRDVAEVAAVTLLGDEHEARTYELTGPSPITFAEVAVALTNATGHPVSSVDLSEEQARPRFESAGLPDWLAAQLAGVFGVIRAGGFENTTDSVRAITGHPARDIEGFAREFATAFTPEQVPAG